MTAEERLQKIEHILDAEFPETPVPLDHSDSYTLLIAVLLSAQCTDERVNKVTPSLFAKANTPHSMIQLSVEEIREIIKPCGLSPKKSRAIWELSHILVNQHNGRVPNTFEALEALPGVGHKTASVVMSQAFGIPAFPVDTHIHRLMYRWKLSNGKSVEQTERDAKRIFKKDTWNKRHLQIIFFGRKYCKAKGYDQSRCPICLAIGNCRTDKMIR